MTTKKVAQPRVCASVRKISSASHLNHVPPRIKSVAKNDSKSHQGSNCMSFDMDLR